MTTIDAGDTSLQLGLEVADEYVLGLPMPVALTIRTGAPGTIRSLPEPTLLSLKNCIAVELADPDSDRVLIRETPTPVLDLEHRPPRLALRGDEARRWLVDLSEVDFSGVTDPGTYELRLRYVAKHAGSEVARARVRLRPPSASERPWLDWARPELDQVDSWGEWVLEPPAGTQPHPDTVPLAARLHAILRMLIHDPRPLAEVPSPPLDSVLPLARPEAETIAIELALAAADTPAAKQLADRSRAALPALAWRLDAVMQGGGLVRNHRLGD